MGSKADNRRVLVVMTNPLGGIRTYLRYNVNYLSGRGYAFSFVGPKGSAFDDFQCEFSDLPATTFWGYDPQNHVMGIMGAVRSARKRERFVLYHSQGLRGGIATALANWRCRVPHVMTLHDVIVEANDVPGRLKSLKAAVAGRITRRVNTIVAVSHDCADNHLDRFPCWHTGSCQLEVIPNGVDVRMLVSEDKMVEENDLRRKCKVPDAAVLGGFFGRFMPQKGFMVLLQALKELAERGYADRMRIVATLDPHGYRGEYVREVKNDATLARMVCFVEPVANIAKLLRQVDLLVMPSLWEACGLLAMEAMVLGVPVVGSDCIGLREVLRDTPGLTPPAGDSHALANSLLEVLDGELKRDASLFRERAELRFDNRAAAERLENVYAKFHGAAPRVSSGA